MPESKIKASPLTHIGWVGAVLSMTIGIPIAYYRLYSLIPIWGILTSVFMLIGGISCMRDIERHYK